MDELSEIRTEYERRIASLLDQNQEKSEFFDKLSVPIIKGSVKNVERQLRQFPFEARQFGNDSKLNFFEEICVMLQEVSMDYYPFVEDSIYACCESAFDGLTPEEKFILNHQTNPFEAGSVEIIKAAFFQYASNFESKKINDAFYARS